MRRPAVDMMTVREIAEEYGYTYQYVAKLTGPTHSQNNANLFRHRVETDETWRAEYNPKARYVYPRTAVARWHRERQAEAWVIGAAKRRNG
jgi:hypothetical protein